MGRKRKATETSLSGQNKYPRPEHDEKRIGFMDLAPELRNQICELAFLETDIIRVRARKRSKDDSYLALDDSQVRPWKEPGLINACKTLRAETSAMYYKVNDFEVTMKMEDMGYLVSWLRVIINRCGKFPVKGFRIYFTRGGWGQVSGTAKLARLIYNTGLRLRCIRLPRGTWSSSSSVGRRNYVFQGFIPNTILHAFLGRTIRLALRASIRQEDLSRVGSEVQKLILTDPYAKKIRAATGERARPRRLAKEWSQEWEKSNPSTSLDVD